MSEITANFDCFYHGQMRDARKLVLKEKLMTAEEIATAIDSEVSKAISEKYCAFAALEDNKRETIYLLPREHANLLVRIER